MDALIFAALSLAVGLVSIYGRSASLRAASYAGLVAGTLLLWYMSLGLPRPEYFHVPSGTVLGYRLDEPKAIYLWLVPNGSVEPLALELPWREEVANNLVDAARRRGNPGDSLQMSSAHGAMGLPSKPVFYVRHPQSLPPKPPEQ